MEHIDLSGGTAIQSGFTTVKINTGPLPAIKGLTEGRIVHYVLTNGQHRPAIVVRNWSNPEIPGSDGMVNLIVFADGSNDRGAVSGNMSEQGLFWATSAHYEPEGKTHYTWHWPEQV